MCRGQMSSFAEMSACFEEDKGDYIKDWTKPLGNKVVARKWTGKLTYYY